MKKFLYVLATAVISLSLLVGCSSQSAGGSTVKKVGTSPDGNEVAIEKAAMSLVKGTSEAGYKLVGTEELKSWVDGKKDMIIIDTMPSDSFSSGRIVGAVNAELPKTNMQDVTAEQKEAFVKLLGNDKSKTVVVYCGFVACQRSHVGATIAKELGFENVYRYSGGITAWRDAKYPEEK